MTNRFIWRPPCPLAPPPAYWSLKEVLRWDLTGHFVEKGARLTPGSRATKFDEIALPPPTAGLKEIRLHSHLRTVPPVVSVPHACTRPSVGPPRNSESRNSQIRYRPVPQKSPECKTGTNRCLGPMRVWEKCFCLGGRNIYYIDGTSSTMSRMGNSGRSSGKHMKSLWAIRCSAWRIDCFMPTRSLGMEM
jgi:hypothetical protein